MAFRPRTTENEDRREFVSEIDLSAIKPDAPYGSAVVRQETIGRCLSTGKPAVVERFNLGAGQWRWTCAICGVDAEV